MVSIDSNSKQKEIQKAKDDSSTTEIRELSAFRGNFSHAIDDKGRVSLPSEFRKVLQIKGEQSIVITNTISNASRCLDGYGLKAWVELEEKLRKKSRFDPMVQKFEIFYLSRATECPLDSSGRILIPAHLRSYAGIEKELTFNSSIHGFRIWDRRVWDHVFGEVEQEYMADPAMFASLDV
jgi:MraZ protein